MNPLVAFYAHVALAVGLSAAVVVPAFLAVAYGRHLARRYGWGR